MAITHYFRSSTSDIGYGYTGYIEDGKIVINEHWPREGGTIFRGTYAELLGTRYIDELKEKAARLYNSIVKYYTEKQNEAHLQEYHDELHDKKQIKETTTSPAGVLWNVALMLKSGARVHVMVRGLSEASVIQKLFPAIPEVLTLQTPEARVIAVRSADISVAEFEE